MTKKHIGLLMILMTIIVAAATTKFNYDYMKIIYSNNFDGSHLIPYGQMMLLTVVFTTPTILFIGTVLLLMKKSIQYSKTYGVIAILTIIIKLTIFTIYFIGMNRVELGDLESVLKNTVYLDTGVMIVIGGATLAIFSLDSVQDNVLKTALILSLALTVINFANNFIRFVYISNANSLDTANIYAISNAITSMVSTPATFVLIALLGYEIIAKDVLLQTDSFIDHEIE